MSAASTANVRTLVAADVVEAAGLCKSVLEETWTNPATLASAIADHDAASWVRYLATRRCYAAARGGELVGVAWVFVSDRTAYVGGAFVRYRREGIGGLLLKARLDYAQEVGCSQAHATVVVGNVASRRNLESAGFRLVEENAREWTFRRSLGAPTND